MLTLSVWKHVKCNFQQIHPSQIYTITFTPDFMSVAQNLCLWNVCIDINQIKTQLSETQCWISIFFTFIQYFPLSACLCVTPKFVIIKNQYIWGMFVWCQLNQNTAVSKSQHNLFYSHSNTNIVPRLSVSLSVCLAVWSINATRIQGQASLASVFFFGWIKYWANWPILIFKETSSGNDSLVPLMMN